MDVRVGSRDQFLCESGRGGIIDASTDRSGDASVPQAAEGCVAAKPLSPLYRYC